MYRKTDREDLGKDSDLVHLHNLGRRETIGSIPIINDPRSVESLPGNLKTMVKVCGADRLIVDRLLENEQLESEMYVERR